LNLAKPLFNSLAIKLSSCQEDEVFVRLGHYWKEGLAALHQIAPSLAT
jgi:hypothetical protein